jgi:hypothetical protein
VYSLRESVQTRIDAYKALITNTMVRRAVLRLHDFPSGSSPNPNAFVRCSHWKLRMDKAFAR